MRLTIATVFVAAGLGPWLPPAPSSWPAYPSFQAHASCWARPTPGGGSRPLRAAPSYVATPTHAQPKQIAARVLSGLGDDRYVHAIQIGPVPRIALMHLKGWFAGARPPKDAAWAYIADPLSVETLPANASDDDKMAVQVATWEGDLVKGALRDDFCDSGGRPLVGWSVSGSPGGVSDRAQALGQRFPSPSAHELAARLAAIGAQFGFTVAEFHPLRARQLAPLVVVQTTRPRKDFVHDVPAIMRLLDPVRSSAHGTAVTFEGFFFEARDADGPFVTVDNVYRGETMGGEWSWDPCTYPYPHSQPFGSTC